MKIVAIDTEYDYLTPFLATSTDEMMRTKVYRPSEPKEYQALKQICEDRKSLKIFHNITADKSRLKNIGIEIVKPYGDTMIASSLVNENYAPRALKKLVRSYLGEETKEANRLKSLITKYKKKAKDEGRIFRWSDIPDEAMIPYAKRDPEYTMQLWYYFKKPLARVKELYEFELSLVPIIVKMHQKGMRVDRTFVRRMVRNYREQIKVLEESIRKYLAKVIKKSNIKYYDEKKEEHKYLSVREFNPGSTKQLGIILQVLKIKTGKLTPTGLPCTNKDSLMGIKHPFVEYLNSLRFYNKHLGTYYEPLLNYYTTPHSDIAHFDLYQAGAKTGRFSAELAQTFPRPGEDKARGKSHEVRKAIIPRKGKVLVCIDYRQIEMWLFIHYTKCTRLIEVASRELDIYLETANILFGALMRKDYLKKPLRKVSKTIALGLIFGMGIGKLIVSVVHEMSISVDERVIRELGISRTWASQVLNKFYQLYPVRQFSHALISDVYRQGYIELLFDSPLMKFHRYYNIPQDLAYKSPNALIQGTAAYIIKHAMLRVSRRIKQEGWNKGGVDLLMQVHDELIFEVDESLPLKPTVRTLVEEMEDHQTFRVPILAEPKVSDVSWADVTKLELSYGNKNDRKNRATLVT